MLIVGGRQSSDGCCVRSEAQRKVLPVNAVAVIIGSVKRRSSSCCSQLGLCGLSTSLSRRKGVPRMAEVGSVVDPNGIQSDPGHRMAR